MLDFTHMCIPNKTYIKNFIKIWKRDPIVQLPNKKIDIIFFKNCNSIIWGAPMSMVQAHFFLPIFFIYIYIYIYIDYVQYYY